MIKFASKSNRAGISTMIVAVIVIIIVVVAGVGAYYVLSSSSPTTTTSQQTTTTASSSSSHSSSSSSQSSILTTTSSSATTSSSSPTSTATTSSQTTSSSTTSETTCFTTYTTGTGATSTPPNFANLFGNFSEMSISFENASSSLATTSSYQVLSTTPSGSQQIYKVNITTGGSSYSASGIGYFYSNGTVAAFDFGGQNLTGASASMATSLMYMFIFEMTAGAELQSFISSSYVQTINTTSVTIGSTTIPVTNYGAKSLPFTYTYCGTTETLSSFTLQIGIVPGTNFNVLTYESLNGSSQSPSGTITFNYVIRLLSITKA